jgi:putative ABC transport system permease protein
VGDIEQKMPDFIKAHFDPFLIARFQKSYDEMYKGGDYYTLFLLPLQQIHLSTLIYENQEGKEMLVYALGLIGGIILLLVCINYTNLATVLSLSRAREAGIRKSVGSRSKTLFKQFITESIIIAFLGLFIALAIVELTLPYFNQLINKSLSLNYSNPAVGCGLLFFTLTLGFLSGFYPALTFASLNPIRALKGVTVSTRTQPWLRNGLVVFQFTVCIVMIVSTLVVYKQLNFMTQKNLGFQKDQVLVIKRAEGLKDSKAAFKNELLRTAGIASASYTETTPGRHFNGHGQHLAGTPKSEFKTIYPFVADEDILETLNLTVVEGRKFEGNGMKRPEAILNEAAVTLLGIKDPLEATIDHGTLGKIEVGIIGVVKDFHFKSFHHKVEPLVLYRLDVDNDPEHRISYMLVRINTADITTVLNNITIQWKKIAGNYPLEYSFLDEDFDKLFDKEKTMAKAYTVFSLISIVLSCLGLLGITSFFAARRTKEIGIRKIVGASILNIAMLLSRDFLGLLLLAITIGSAIAWYAMEAWMQGFVYKIELSWWYFVLGGASVLFFAVCTVSWHLYNAASRNPVDTLKYE